MEQIRAADGSEPLDDADGPSEQMEQAERCRQVRQAIAALQDEYRAVLVLREIDGCCYETIAEILDLPVGTVRSRLHRARMQLREATQRSVDDRAVNERVSMDNAAENERLSAYSTAN